MSNVPYDIDLADSAGADAVFAAGMSRHPDPAVAIGEVVGDVAERLGEPPSVAMLFVSGNHILAMGDIVDAVDTLLNPAVLIGATSTGLVGGAEEVERGAAVALWAATGLPVEPVRLDALPGHPPVLAGLPDKIHPGSTLVMVADPATYPVDALIAEVDQHHPSLAVVGGLASAPAAEDNRIVFGPDVHLDGAAGFLIAPGRTVPVVSQGCRPIGSPWVITGADGQLVRELGGVPALERLTTVLEGLTPDERAVAARGLHVGVVADEHRDRFERGDFLVRAVLGADRSTGAVAIGDRIDVGQILQFQIREPASASAELARLMPTVPGRSALVFTCEDRGTKLFDRPNHDAEVVHESIGDAVAGMFCVGEVGPVGERNAIHGFTATVLVFR